MKILGLIGGMSWESTALYYRIINTQIKKALGNLHSAKLLIYSFDFEEIAVLQKAGLWQEATQKMIEAAGALKAGGAEALVICTNTMHMMAEEVQQAAQLPLLHIADFTALEIKRHNIHTVGLLGTQFTMEKPFYKKRLEDKFGVKVIIPEEKDRMIVHRVIYDELCKGVVNPASRLQYDDIIKRLKMSGAQGIILGCTEIGLLIEGQENNGLPLFDTTIIHATYAAEYAVQ